MDQTVEGAVATPLWDPSSRHFPEAAAVFWCVCVVPSSTEVEDGMSIYLGLAGLDKKNTNQGKSMPLVMVT